MADDVHTRKAWNDSADARDSASTPTPSPDFDGIPSTRITKWTISGEQLLGSQIDNFRVEGIVAQGGFGLVCKATDVKLNRVVALKFLKNRLDEKHFQLFEREARILARLGKEPSIVEVYAWGEYQGYNYFAMEYLPLTADAILQKHPTGLNPARAIEIVADCAEALASAHREGIVHRDIKPPNILLDSEEGRAKLADFGLSRILESTESIIGGTISGSPPYMSPEQASAEPADHRSDIFSLGVSLYELLCGKRPFEAASSGEYLENIRNNIRVPLAKRRVNLPPNVIQAVERATRHAPKDRFQSAEEFACVLRGILATLPDYVETTISGRVGTRFGQRVRFLRKPILWGLAAVLVFVSGLWFTTSRPLPEITTDLKVADAALDQGDAVAAAARYQKILAKDPASDPARYGLAYAFLRQGKLDDAAGAFADLNNESLRVEGNAAVAYAENGAEAAPVVEKAVGNAQTAYLQALGCAIELDLAQYSKVVSVGKGLQDASFPFEWQRAELLQALGQAYYRLGNFADAKAIFSRLKPLTSSAPEVANAYLRLANARLDEQLQDKALTRAAEIRDLIDSGAVPVMEDQWSSRPLTFVLLPVEANPSDYANRSGLVDVLPMLLGEELESRTALNLVDRELIGEVLAEQKLSALLSQQAGQLEFGRILGARLIMRCIFGRLGGSEFVKAKVVDAETGEEVIVPRVDLQRSTSPDALLGTLADEIGHAVKQHYPLRARLTREGDRARIDIGSSEGVQPAMRFQIAVGADRSTLIPDRLAIVEEPVDVESAHVRVDGFSPADIPEDGLYVVQQNVTEQR